MDSERMGSVMVIPTFLFLSLLAGSLAQNPELSSDENYNYPDLWDEVSGDISEFPVQNNKIIIDIWKYVDRLRMYKILFNKSDEYFFQLGQNNTGNALWALNMFFGRLYKTDRLSEPSDSSVCAYGSGCISHNSGWGGINFYVVAFNFLAAVESGFLGDIPYEIEFVRGKERRSDYCYSLHECRAAHPMAMNLGKRYYKYLKSKTTPPTAEDTLDTTAIKYMWDTHQAAIDIGTAKFNSISEYSSAAERDFTMDFLLAIEFCEAAEYRPYFESAAELLEGFPHRPLTDEDAQDLPDDFSTRQKAMLVAVKLIRTINDFSGGVFLTLWKTLMALSDVNKALGRFFIKRLLLIPSFW
ncbi:protein LEG1 homolog [Ochotona princeps]|uniref:protein LEG1 homolog n=1 Tax=Ochotona princeps TaxID=9978 RepID=UPI002714EC52|nr:protein LEG1 homolog [Ochotona princeps]